VSTPDPAILAALIEAIDETHSARASRPVVIGLCGAQGSGKTTLAQAAVEGCLDKGIVAAILSIDDIYLTRPEREVLAREIHPLLATRGPPGTHDVALGEAVFNALARGEAAGLPRFDKARDDRVPQSQWPETPEGCEVFLLEGWCVGARPQPDADLTRPVNELEELEDRQAIWRRHVNAALASNYQRLFARLGCLVMLAAPGFEVVFDWRMQQEVELRARVGSEATGVMDAEQVARFIQHYERLTRYMLAEMPGRATLLVRLDEKRKPLEIRRNPRESR
jgi:D-glycerate 3-kinase